MSAKTRKSNPQRKAPDKKKATAANRASSKVAMRPGQKTAARARASTKEASQSRFPGERPLTCEDRPANRPGHKVRGQSGNRRRPTLGRGRGV